MRLHFYILVNAMAYCNQAWLGLVRHLGNHLNCAAARLLLVAWANQALEMKLDPDGFATPMCIKKHWQTSVSAEGISSEGGSGVPNFLHHPPHTPSISYSSANTKSQSELNDPSDRCQRGKMWYKTKHISPLALVLMLFC